MSTNDFLSPYGARKYTDGVANAASVATLAALTALGAAHPARVHGNEVRVDSDGSLWRWHSTSTLTAVTALVVAADDAPSAGRWLRVAGRVVLAFPFTFATADAAILATFPTGCRFRLHETAWKVSTTFAGGSSSAIGASSSTISGATTKGDLLGGASGDVAATLVSTAANGFVSGTAGATMDSIANKRTKIFVPTSTLRFDRITSAFTSGVGEVQLIGDLELNLGA